YGAGMFLVILGLSRVQTLVALAIPLIWALAQRRWLVLFTAFIGIAVFIIMLNMNTGVFERLPEGTRRSLSGLVVLRYVPEHQVTFGSDSWHYYLLRAGKERWLQSYGTFLCGNKLHAYSVVNMPLSTSAEDSADFAAKLTAYENAFFTVTASLGLVGLLLFIRVLYWLYRPFFGEVVRRGLRGPDGALLYLACQTFILYVAFAWISGGWPVEPILLGTLAAAGYYDRSRGTDGSVSKDGCPGGSLISDSAARQQTKDGTYRRTESGGPPARHTLPGNIDRNRDDSCG
ncbi:MAG: hypothetical protein NTY53_24370, partial [Kiritimatiellaeota bacterium]|nr:hypothetical protein [Kiritimatiellota bacterium]